ncbi:MAG: DNA polymerase Y family protein [Marmoricola sp.]
MRALVVWCPDWPVVAALTDADQVAGTRPVAVVTRGGVMACNDTARVQGVARGMRRRDAQSRCPELQLFDANPDRDVRVFEPVIAAVEELRPGVAPLRPGMLAIKAPGRFYGGEEHAAATIAEKVVEVGVRDVRIGVADDLFTAEQAARLAEVQGWRVVERGASQDFLGALPIEVLEGEDLVGLLRRLGLRTLGEFAALPARDVLTRFGAYGAQVHRLASGADPALPATRTPPPDLASEVVFEPALVSVEAVSFSVRRTAEQFVAALGERGLVCTALRVEAEGDDVRHTVLSSRSWVHSRWFSANDVVDRVHWQLQASPSARGSGYSMVGAPVGLVRFVPEVVEQSAAHADGLWGSGTDELVDRGVARVQAMLGYDAVVVPVRQGGRGPADRQLLVPWGERPQQPRQVDLPWTGSLPPPAPSRVFTEPWATSVVTDQGRPVRLTERAALSGVPAKFLIRHSHTGSSPGWQHVETWAGPWPVDERWWESGAAEVPVARFQVVGVDGRAWLMRCEGDTWVTEASYD